MFGLRLFLSFGIALGVLGIVGYQLILRELRTSGYGLGRPSPTIETSPPQTLSVTRVAA